MLFLNLKINIKMKRFKIFTICYFFISIYYSQIGELDRFDCNYSKEITIPFDFSETSSIIHPQLNQVVFYSYRDQFTYWYKITAKSNEKLIYSVCLFKNEGFKSAAGRRKFVSLECFKQ